MSKGDAPALRMRVENLRLVPAFSYDQERLASFRNGSELRVVPTQPKNDKLNRKFHAILHRVLADCRTPWKTVEEAKESLKMALGVTRQAMPIGGDKPFRYPRSLAELDEPEFVDFYEGAVAILHKITGVDPETLNAESADVGDDEPSLAPTPADDAAAEAIPSTSVADPSSSQESGEAGGNSGDEPDTPPADKLSDDDRAFLVRVFTTMKAAVGPDIDVFTNQAKIFKDEIAGKSVLVKAKATKIRTELQRCCGEDAKVGTVEIGRYIAGLIGVEERELVG